MTTPPDTPSSAGLTLDEASARSRRAADPTPRHTLSARRWARENPTDPSEWDRRAHATQVVTALDTTEALAAALMARNLDTLDQLLAPAFCWWSVPRRSGSAAQTRMPLPLEPLATRSTFLALVRRWRHAFGDLSISMGPSLIDTEERLLGPADAPAMAHAILHEDGAAAAESAARPGGFTVLMTSGDHPPMPGARRRVRPAPSIAWGSASAPASAPS